jgi:hypothetical protein
MSRIKVVKMNLDVLSRGHAGRKAKGELVFRIAQEGLSFLQKVPSLLQHVTREQ